MTLYFVLQLQVNAGKEHTNAWGVQPHGMASQMQRWKPRETESNPTNKQGIPETAAFDTGHNFTFIVACQQLGTGIPFSSTKHVPSPKQLNMHNVDREILDIEDLTRFCMYLRVFYK